MASALMAPPGGSLPAAPREAGAGAAGTVLGPVDADDGPRDAGAAAVPEAPAPAPPGRGEASRPRAPT
jgi:hypothetical protein